MIFTVSYGAYLPNAIELRFMISSVKIKHLRRFGRFYLLRVSTSKRSPKRMQLSLMVGIAFGFWFPDDPDFRISGFLNFGFPDFSISGFLVFWISGFQHFRFTCQPAAGWIEGLFEVVALKSQFSDPKWDLPSWFSDSGANFHLWTVVLPSYLARNVTQFHLFWASDC